MVKSRRDFLNNGYYSLLCEEICKFINKLKTVDCTLYDVGCGEGYYTSKIKSLQREKDQASEVKSGYDCGIVVDNFPDIKDGDMMEVFENREVKK